MLNKYKAKFFTWLLEQYELTNDEVDLDVVLENENHNQLTDVVVYNEDISVDEELQEVDEVATFPNVITSPSDDSVEVDVDGIKKVVNSGTPLSM